MCAAQCAAQGDACATEGCKEMMLACLNGRLILTDSQFAVTACCGLPPCYVLELILLTLYKAVIGELPPIRVCLAKALHHSTLVKRQCVEW